MLFGLFMLNFYSIWFLVQKKECHLLDVGYKEYIKKCIYSLI